MPRSKNSPSKRLRNNLKSNNRPGFSRKDAHSQSLRFERLEPRHFLTGVGNPVFQLEVDFGIHLEDGVVAEWHDSQSGNDHELVANGTRRPAFGTVQTPSGLDAIRFDGVNDRLIQTIDSGFIDLPDGNSDRTIFVVAQFHGASWDAGIGFGAGAPNETFGVAVEREGSATEGQFLVQGWGGGNDFISDESGFTDAGGGQSTGWVILAVTHDADNAGDSTQFYRTTSIDAGQEILSFDHDYNTNLSNGGLLNGNSASRFVIGEEISELGFTEIDVAAILVYDEALDAVDRGGVEEYLQQKYLVGDIQNQLVAGGLDQPTSLEVLPDGRILVLEKEGDIRIVDPTQDVPTAEPYLSITNVNSERERGLTDIALDPDFENNNYFYVYYHTDGADGDIPRARLSRFTNLGDNATLASEVVLWQDLDNSNLSPNHWGGGLDFGPDGKLYLTIGDKFLDPTDAQDPQSYGGKILRLNTDGSVPADNPFVGDDPDGFLDEIWAYGLRNPFRANWDIPTGRFFIGDVGGNVQETAFEEINLGVAGANYGWPGEEGFNTNAEFTDPIFAYDHSEPTPNGGAVAGGIVYRGELFSEQFEGAYFFGDFVQGWIRYLRFDENGGVIDADPSTPQLDAFELSDEPIAPVAIEVGSSGELLYLDFFTGELRQFVSGNLAPEIVEASSDIDQGLAPLVVNFTGLAEDPEGDDIQYVWDFGDGNQAFGANVSHTYAANGFYEATLRASDGFQTTVSEPVAITVGEAPAVTIVTPYEGQFFIAGETISLSGLATDDGELTEESYSWTIRFLHNDHTHPVLDGATGSNITFEIDRRGHDFSDETGFEIELVVTDSDGISTTETVAIFPDKVDVTFDTTFPGDLTFTLDGVPREGSFIHDTLINFEHTISVPVFANYNGDEYEFVAWSDGSTDSSYVFDVPDSDITLTAIYQNNGSSTSLPTDDLVLRLDAQNGVTVDGTGTVTAWTDQSGFANSLAATGDPTLIENELNGHDVIRFDGTGDSLRALTLNSFPEGNENRSLFVVARYDGVGYGGVSYGDNSLNETFGAIVDPSGNLTAQGWGSSNDFRTDVAATGEGWLIQELILTNGVLTHFRDAVLIDTQNHVFSTDVDNGNGFIIGAEIDSNPFIDMDVAEVLVYDRALSPTDRQQVENYLLEKYFSNSNSAPTANDDAFTVDESSVNNVIDVKADNGNGADVDPDGDPISIVAVGTPSLGGSVTINNNGTAVDTTDDFLQYTPSPGVVGTETFTYTISDGVLTSEATVTVTIDAADANNSAPVNTLPGTIVVEAPNAVVVFGVSIADSDAGGESVTSQLVVGTGTLEVTLVGDATISSGSNLSNDFTLLGTVADINATLASLEYTPQVGFLGTDQLTITTDDLGNTGEGGPLQDTDSVSILVVPGLPSADLVVRLDAQTGVSENENGVIGLADQSGFGNDLSGTGDPQRVVGGLNGLDYIEFDGSGDSLIRATGLNNLPEGNEDRSLFVVVRYDGVGFGGVAYGDNSFNETFGAIVNPNGFLTAQGWGTANDFHTTTAGTSEGWLIQEIVLTAGTLEHFRDGVLIDSQTHTFNTDVANGNGFVIGAEIDSNPFVDLDVAEVLLYDRALDSTDRQAVESYLLGKYFGVFNTAPIANDDAFTVDESSVDNVIDVKADNGNGADVDPDGDPISIVAVGTPSLGGSVTINNNGTAVDTTDDFLQYTPSPGVVGTETFTYTISDGVLTSEATVTVTIDAADANNSAPVNTLPGTIVVEAPNAVVVFGVSIADSDAGGESVTSQLVVGTGTLEVTLVGDATISSGSNLSNDFTLLGTVADINATLASLEYTPQVGFLGTDQLTITTDDLGNTGEGGPLQDTDSVSILVVPGLPSADLVVRLDAQTGVSENENGVIGLADQSGFGNDLSGTGDPQRVVGGLNGLDYIEFDGSGDSLIRATGLNNLPEGNEDRSLFVVVRYDGVGFGGVAYGDNSFNETFGAIVNPNGFLTAQGWGTANDFHTTTAGTSEGWLIQEIVLTAGTLEHFRDGVLIDSQTHTFNTDVANGNGFVIGAEIDSNPFVDLDVAEVLLYDRALDSTDRQAVESYLLGKYFGVFNTAPVANDDAALVVENSTNVVIDVKADNGNGVDTDPEGDPLSIVGVSVPDEGGTVVINDNGTPVDTTDDFVEYTPASDFTGVETFTYVISDGTFVDSATVTIDVIASGGLEFNAGNEQPESDNLDSRNSRAVNWVIPFEFENVSSDTQSGMQKADVGIDPTQDAWRESDTATLTLNDSINAASIELDDRFEIYNKSKAERDGLLDTLFEDTQWDFEEETQKLV